MAYNRKAEEAALTLLALAGARRPKLRSLTALHKRANLSGTYENYLRRMQRRKAQNTTKKAKKKFSS